MISARLLVPLCAIVAACGTSGADDVPTDAGRDGSHDASTDGKADSGADSGKMDSGADTGVDAGTDSGEEDAGSDAADEDSGPPILDGGGPDASLCKSNFGFGTVSMNSCSAGENWTCGNDTYEFECFCPGAACVCTKNNQPVLKVSSPNGCPNCGFNGATIASLCGFPY